MVGYYRCFVVWRVVGVGATGFVCCETRYSCRVSNADGVLVMQFLMAVGATSKRAADFIQHDTWRV